MECSLGFTLQSMAAKVRKLVAAPARLSSLLLLTGVALMTFCAQGASKPLSISQSDLWDVSRGARVIASSGVLNTNRRFSSQAANMFGATLPNTVEPSNTLFADHRPAGSVHSVEWKTPSPVTLRSFALFATHDGGGRDARYRGLKLFKLFAWNSVTNQFDLIFQYSLGNAYGTSVAPPNGFLASNCTSYNTLCLGVNIAPTVTDRFRAEFVQLGQAGNASGPRIVELDGYDKRFEIAPPPVATSSPEPVRSRAQRKAASPPSDFGDLDNLGTLE